MPISLVENDCCWSGIVVKFIFLKHLLFFYTNTCFIELVVTGGPYHNPDHPPNAGNALMTPQVLRVYMGSGDRLPSDVCSIAPYFHKKKYNLLNQTRQSLFYGDKTAVKYIQTYHLVSCYRQVYANKLALYHRVASSEI